MLEIQVEMLMMKEELVLLQPLEFQLNLLLKIANLTMIAEWLLHEGFQLLTKLQVRLLQLRGMPVKTLSALLWLQGMPVKTLAELQVMQK